MKFVRRIIEISRARYVALPKGLFPDVRKVLMDIKYMKDNTSVIMKLTPYEMRPARLARQLEASMEDF